MKNWPNEHHLFNPTDKLLIAVSGGVDSIVLCELCKQAGYKFAIAHMNFQLRAEESDGDEEFVRELSKKYAVELFVRKADTVVYAEQNKVSIQVAARELRYLWFDDLLAQGFDWLLTAHHQGDNIETVLMNFFRGTGIEGLHGIKPKKDKILRPLLRYSKEDIIAFANDQGLQWREDSSNSSDKYSRNYFRQSIIPLVSRIFPAVEQNIAANIERLGEVETLYHQAIDLHRKKLLEQKGKEIHIPVLKLKQVKPLATVVYELVKPYNFSPQQVPDIIRLLDAEQGKYVHSATHRIIRNRNWLIICTLETQEAGIVIIDRKMPVISFDGGRLLIEHLQTAKIADDKNIALLNAKALEYPLILRKWKQGDYFYPLGMNKKKKISRFLIDQKLSPTAKEQIWVIESAKKICWIVGMRIDNRFKVEDATRKVVSIAFKTS